MRRSRLNYEKVKPPNSNPFEKLLKEDRPAYGNGCSANAHNVPAQSSLIE
ncbi:hypothetical protein [Spirosoma pollinicola]|nr:hypothetical protein [Spirosoma pollinicola]